MTAFSRMWIFCDRTHEYESNALLSPDKSREDYTIWSLYLVFVGVTLPRELAFKTDTTYLPFFEGHENNAHCLPIAVNALAGAIFALYGETQQRERMKEFLVVSALNLSNQDLYIYGNLYTHFGYIQCIV